MRITLPCGCPVIVKHPKGDLRVVCEGGGITGLRPSIAEMCPGGRAYCVTAEEVTTIRYAVRPLAVLVEES